MAYYQYGVIGENGPIEGVSITSPHNKYEMDRHLTTNQPLNKVHADEMRKRFTREGATETRYFPIN